MVSLSIIGRNARDERDIFMVSSRQNYAILYSIHSQSSANFEGVDGCVAFSVFTRFNARSNYVIDYAAIKTTALQTVRTFSGFGVSSFGVRGTVRTFSRFGV